MKTKAAYKYYDYYWFTDSAFTCFFIANLVDFKEVIVPKENLVAQIGVGCPVSNFLIISAEYWSLYIETLMLITFLIFIWIPDIFENNGRFQNSHELFYFWYSEGFVW